MRLPATRSGLLALHVTMQLSLALVCGVLALSFTTSRLRDLDVSSVVGCWMGTAAFGALVVPRVSAVALLARRRRFEHAALAAATSACLALAIDWLARPTLGDLTARWLVELTPRSTAWAPSWLANGWRMAALGAVLCFFSALRLLARAERDRQRTSMD